MKNQAHAQEELHAIRQMMERSSKFLSLSGLSGLVSGAIALAGAAWVHWGILQPAQLNYAAYLQGLDTSGAEGIGRQLLATAIVVLALALAGAILLSLRKAKKTGQQFNSKASRQLLWHLLVPLIAGGLLSLILYRQNEIQLLAAITLLFYGLALVNAGKFTFGELQTLGLIEIGLGLLAALFPNLGLWCWALGFGVMHMAYGLLVYRKYERNSPQQ